MVSDCGCMKGRMRPGCPRHDDAARERRPPGTYRHTVAMIDKWAREIRLWLRETPK